MRNLLRKITGSAGYLLLVIHGVGMLGSFIYFSWQYAREHGFTRWLFWGEVVPALKATVWEVFVVLALLQGPPHAVPTPIIEQLPADNWWFSEYAALVETVEKSENNTLSTSYATGPRLSAKVEISLFKKPGGSLVLKLKPPREAVFSVDPKTGDEIPSKTAPTITIRDHNLDGLPDDFLMEPSGESVYREKYTDDGFTIYRDSPDHQVFLAQWVIGIGYSTNYFLHGVESFRPRQEL